MARKPSLRKQIDALLSKHDPLIKAAFLESIDDIRSKITLKVFADRLKRGDIDGAIDALHLDQAAFARLEAAIAQAYGAGGSAMVGNMPTLRDTNGAKLVIWFDVRNPRAERWLRGHSLNLVTRIIDDQRNGIRDALVKGMSQGRNPNNVALDIIGRVNRATGRRTGGLIGLTGQQSQYVSMALDELASGDKSALRNYLTRARRDISFDKTVLKAIREGKPIDRSTINRMIGRYSDRLLQLRGETIARTEALASLHAGKDEGFRQGLDKTNYPFEAVTKIWRSAGDGRVRHSHSAMNGQEVIGMNAAFQSPNGARLNYPGDTSLGASANEVINCRCTTDYRIDFSFGLE